MRNLRIRAAFASVAVFAMIGAACASSTTTSSAQNGSSSTGTGVCASVDTSTGDALAKVCQSGVLRVATDPKYQPQSWFDTATNTWNGFDVEVAAEVANRLGVTSEPQAQKWAAITAGSWSDRWDVSVGSMTDTVDRETLFYFTPPYYYTPAGVAVYQDNTTINDVSTDLDGKKICVGVQTTYQDYVNGTLVLGSTAPKFDFLIDNAQLQTYDTDTDSLDNLSLGDGVRCDAAITAVPTIQAYIADGGPVKQVGEPLFFEPLCIAFDKNAPSDEKTLADAVGKIVDQMHADGTLSELSKKWYDGQDLTQATS